MTFEHRVHPPPGFNFSANATAGTNGSFVHGHGGGGGFGNDGFGPGFSVAYFAEDLAPMVNGTIWLLVGLALAFLSLRLYCKRWRQRRLWWDDLLLSMSWLALAASASLLTYATSLGFGKHSVAIAGGSNIVHLLLVSQLAGFCSLLAALWSKISFAMTLLRISDGWTRRFVWFVIVSVTLALGFNAGLQMIECWPAAALWDPSVKGKCLPKTVIYGYNMFSASYSGAMDISLSFLPWQIIWRVTMNKREKLGVVLAMSMGVFAGITSIAKTAFLSAIMSADFIHAVPLMILATAQGAITIIAASVPILRPLFQRSDFSEPKFMYDVDTVTTAAPRFSIVVGGKRLPTVSTLLRWRESRLPEPKRPARTLSAVSVDFQEWARQFMIVEDDEKDHEGRRDTRVSELSIGRAF